MSGAPWRKEPPEHVDVLIVGAGLSGIGAACRLRMDRPGTSVAILESRQAMGGTWDLFRYPGVRSDSDMFTLGFSFRPWEEPKAIADGPSMRATSSETARDCGVADAVRYGHTVESASWSTPDARWTVRSRRGDTGEVVEMTCAFLYMCTGYYRYSAGYTPPSTAWRTSRARSCTPSTGPRAWTSAGRRSSSWAAGRRP